MEIKRSVELMYAFWIWLYSSVHYAIVLNVHLSLQSLLHLSCKECHLTFLLEQMSLLLDSITILLFLLSSFQASGALHIQQQLVLLHRVHVEEGPMYHVLMCWSSQDSPASVDSLVHLKFDYKV